MLRKNKITESDINRIINKILNEETVIQVPGKFENFSGTINLNTGKVQNQPTEYTLDTTINLENNKSNFPELKLFPGSKFIIKYGPDNKPYLISEKQITAQYANSDTGEIYGDQNNSNESVGKKNKAFVYYSCSLGKFYTRKNTTVTEIYGNYGSPEKMFWYAQPNQVQPFSNVCKTKKPKDTGGGSKEDLSDFNVACEKNKGGAKVAQGKSYKYCKFNNEYYFKGTAGDIKTRFPNWTKATAKVAIDSIKQKVFKEA